MNTIVGLGRQSMEFEPGNGRDADRPGLRHGVADAKTINRQRPRGDLFRGLQQPLQLQIEPVPWHQLNIDGTGCLGRKLMATVACAPPD